MADVNFDLKLAIKDFQNSLNQAKSSVGSFSNDTNKALKDTENSINGLTPATKNATTSFGSMSLSMFAGNVAATALSVSLGFVKSTIEGSLAAYAGSEEALNKLAQSMKLTGTFSEEASKQVEAFATKLEASSKFSDDAIITQVAYARSLGLSTDQAEKLVQAAANMSATLGGGLEENVAKLGLTLDGTAGRLARLIPGLKGLTEEQLKAGAAADYINNKFSGAAASDLTTYAGKVAYLKNQYDNMQESIGGLIINSGLFQSAMDNIKTAILATTKFMADNKTAIDLVVSALSTTASFVGDVLIGTLKQLSLPLTFLVTQWDNIKLAFLNGVLIIEETSLRAKVALNSMLGSNFDTKTAQKDLDDTRKKIEAITNASKAKNAEDAKAVPQASKTDALAKDLTLEQNANKARLVEHKSMLDQKANLTIAGEQSILAIETQAANDKANLDIANSNLSLEAKQLAYQTQLETRIAQEADELVRRQQLQIQELNEINQHELAKAALITTSNEKKKAIEDAKNKDSIARTTLANKQALEAATFAAKNQKALDEKAAADKKASDDLRVANQKDTFATIATLAGSNNKTLAVIGKAAAITQIAIDGPQAVTKALAAFPPPFNFAAAGLVGAAVAAQAAKVAGLNFANGGFVPGNSFSGDRVQANVNSGEAVLNVSQQKNFMEIANGGSNSNGSLLNAINSLGDRIMSMEIRLVANDDEIARSVSRGVQNGIVIGTSR